MLLLVLDQLKNVAQFLHNFKMYLYNPAYTCIPQLTNLSIHLLTTGIFID